MRGIVDTPDDDPIPLAVARQRRLQRWGAAATACSNGLQQKYGDGARRMRTASLPLLYSANLDTPVER